ncbi:MAG: hypothetical protein MZV70_60170 [Desulfobacterales bacterium]|nr:hypothetical protein [Desulfobacterales bacterium]
MTRSNVERRVPSRRSERCGADRSRRRRPAVMRTLRTRLQAASPRRRRRRGR